MIAKLRKLIYLEFELLECCRQLMSESSLQDQSGATLLYLEGTAQQHIFDLDNHLRSVGESPVSYSVCVHKTLFSRRGVGEILTRLQAAYERCAALAANNPITDMLRSNLSDIASARPRLAAA